MAIFSGNRDFKLVDVNAGHLRVTYKGISAVKSPFDYVLYQMLVWEIQPDLIIEIGTHEGGSALYLADILSMIGKGEVHTIDVEPVKIHSSVIDHPRIHFFSEGYENYDTSKLKGYEKIMVIEDGSHIYEDCLGAIQKFAPFVTRGSYFIVEDGIVTELGRRREFNGGPQRAIATFLEGNQNFIIDRKWCDFFGANATFNVNGYLKRIS